MTTRLPQPAFRACIPILTLIATLLFGATLAACQSGEHTDAGDGEAGFPIIRDAGALQPALADGLKRWQASVQSAGATYFYWRVRPGSESGVREITGVQIVNGRATRRYITRARINHAGGGEASVFERVNEVVGAGRPNAAGFPARTMETLYENCRRILPRGAADPTAGRNHFELRLDPRGVLRACSIAEKQCQGDCTTNYGAAGLVFRELSASEVDAFMKTTNPRLKP